MIRKTLTALGAALALTMGLAAPASATVVASDFSAFVMMQFGDGLSTTGDFGDGPLAAGTKVDDFFLFYSSPVSSQIDFDVEADKINSAQSFKLTGIDFGVFNGYAYDVDGNYVGVDVTPYALDQEVLAKSGKIASGESADFVDPGIYYVEVKGTTLLAGGGFSGEINTTPIPEPSNIALLLAGLGIMGTLARRRNRG